MLSQLCTCAVGTINLYWLSSYSLEDLLHCSKNIGGKFQNIRKYQLSVPWYTCPTNRLWKFSAQKAANQNQNSWLQHTKSLWTGCVIKNIHRLNLQPAYQFYLLVLGATFLWYLFEMVKIISDACGKMTCRQKTTLIGISLLTKTRKKAKFSDIV